MEVTSEGLANNLHLIGQSEFWQNKLQDGLINWDHDRDIIENISQIFGKESWNRHFYILIVDMPVHI